MLVFNRHIDEEVVITTTDGRRVIVTVVGLRDDRVRLGFTADRDIEIHRGEVQAEVDRERHESPGGGRPR